VGPRLVTCPTSLRFLEAVLVWGGFFVALAVRDCSLLRPPFSLVSVSLSFPNPPVVSFPLIPNVRPFWELYGRHNRRQPSLVHPSPPQDASSPPLKYPPLLPLRLSHWDPLPRGQRRFFSSPPLLVTLNPFRPKLFLFPFFFSPCSPPRQRPDSPFTSRGTGNY